MIEFRNVLQKKHNLQIMYNFQNQYIMRSWGFVISEGVRFEYVLRATYVPLVLIFSSLFFLSTYMQ